MRRTDTVPEVQTVVQDRLPAWVDEYAPADPAALADRDRLEAHGSPFVFFFDPTVSRANTGNGNHREI